ncbi:MAG: DnaJ domain-containing protein [Hespellia sp.]|nr:DnaJ domain-containing protein [Hespellia sp.]
MEIWDELEIESTTDTRTIKKAYARLMTKYHPEEYPEKFQEIHRAYEMAMQYAKGQKTDEQPEVHTQDSGEQPDTKTQDLNEDIWTKEPQWLQSEQISRMADRYAVEDENKKNRSLLYDRFMQDIAWDRLNFIEKNHKIQSQELWEQYFQDKLVLEAIHYSEFLTKFVNRIEGLKFKKKTIQMMETCFKIHAPEEYARNNRLQHFLKVEGPTRIRNRHIQYAGYVIGMIFFVTLSGNGIFGSIRNSQKTTQTETLHTPANMETYLEEEYGIECSVEETDIDSMNQKSKIASDPAMDYYIVTVENDKVKDFKFHINWRKASEDQTEMVEDFDSELVKNYAGVFDIDMADYFSSRNKIRINKTTMQKYAPQFLDFINALHESSYVQSGHTIELMVAPLPDITESSFEIRIKKDLSIDEADIMSKVEACVNEANSYAEMQESTGE